MDDQLYDKVHAVVTNWLVGILTGGELFEDETNLMPEVFPEYPYNYYGQRGSVDVLAFYDRRKNLPSLNEPHNEIEIFEVWTAVQRLEESLRKFNEKALVVPKFFRANRKPVPRIDGQRNYFVLLNTMQNVMLVRDHLDIFRAQFSREKTASTDDWDSTKHLIFVDPLNPKYVEERWTDPDGTEPWALYTRPWREAFTPNNRKTIESNLQMDDRDNMEWTPFEVLNDWIYPDAKQFWTEWQKEKGKSRTDY